MGDLFEAIRREVLVRQRDLLAQWTSKNAVLLYADDGVYAKPEWGDKLVKLIKASAYIFPEDGD